MSENGVKALTANTEARSESEAGVWSLDVSTGTEILVYENCSVIEDAQARYVFRLIADQRGPVAKDVAVLVVAARAAAYEDWTEEVRASLDEAVEAFSERVAWECDDEIGVNEKGHVDPAVLDAIASEWDAHPIGASGEIGRLTRDNDRLEQLALEFRRTAIEANERVLVAETKLGEAMEELAVLHGKDRAHTAARLAMREKLETNQ